MKFTRDSRSVVFRPFLVHGIGEIKKRIIGVFKRKKRRDEGCSFSTFNVILCDSRAEGVLY